MHQISLWILLVLASSCYCKLTIGAFNVQQFGPTKLGNKKAVDSIVKVIRGYDIILIQEIVMSDPSLFQTFVESLNQPIKTFDYKISKRLGPGNHKEQYGFIYNIRAVNITKDYQYIDEIQFSRPPYCVEVEELTNHASPTTPLNKFWMVGLHTRPGNTICELQKLQDVYKALKSPERVVFLGDFNADCTYFEKYDELKIPFLFNSSTSGMNMLPFKNNATTNLGGNCTYDRIVVSKSVFDDVLGNQAEVGNFDRVPTGNRNRPEAVSDHFPIKMTLQVRKRKRPPLISSHLLSHQRNSHHHKGRNFRSND